MAQYLLHEPKYPHHQIFQRPDSMTSPAVIPVRRRPYPNIDRLRWIIRRLFRFCDISWEAHNQVSGVYSRRRDSYRTATEQLPNSYRTVINSYRQTTGRPVTQCIWHYPSRVLSAKPMKKYTFRNSFMKESWLYHYTNLRTFFNERSKYVEI